MKFSRHLSTFLRNVLPRFSGCIAVKCTEKLDTWPVKNTTWFWVVFFASWSKLYFHFFTLEGKIVQSKTYLQFRRTCWGLLDPTTSRRKHVPSYLSSFSHFLGTPLDAATPSWNHTQFHLPIPPTLFTFPESTFYIVSSPTPPTPLPKQHFLLPKVFSDSSGLPWLDRGAGCFPSVPVS